MSCCSIAQRASHDVRRRNPFVECQLSIDFKDMGSKMISSGLEPETARVLSECDNQLHHETRCRISSLVRYIADNENWDASQGGFEIRMP